MVQLDPEVRALTPLEDLTARVFSALQMEDEAHSFAVQYALEAQDSESAQFATLAKGIALLLSERETQLRENQDHQSVLNQLARGCNMLGSSAQGLTPPQAVSALCDEIERLRYQVNVCAEQVQQAVGTRRTLLEGIRMVIQTRQQAIQERDQFAQMNENQRRDLERHIRRSDELKEIREALDKAAVPCSGGPGTVFDAVRDLLQMRQRDRDTAAGLRAQMDRTLAKLLTYDSGYAGIDLESIVADLIKRRQRSVEERSAGRLQAIRARLQEVLMLPEGASALEAVNQLITELDAAHKSEASLREELAKVREDLDEALTRDDPEPALLIDLLQPLDQAVAAVNDAPCCAGKITQADSPQALIAASVQMLQQLLNIRDQYNAAASEYHYAAQRAERCLRERDTEIEALRSAYTAAAVARADSELHYIQRIANPHRFGANTKG